MNKQYSGQSWRLPQPVLADASERLGMQSLAFKHALGDHSQLMLAFNEGLAHNLGAAWRRFFKIADRSRRAVQALKVARSTPSRLAIKATGIRAISSSASSSNWAIVGVNDISYLWRHTCHRRLSRG
jgi:hypothetical protein